MGTHEIIIFSNVTLLAYNDFKIPPKISMYYFCRVLWNFNGCVSDPAFLLCIYFHPWQKCFYFWYLYVHFEYCYCLLAFLQTHVVLSLRTLYSFTMCYGVHSLCLLFSIYLSSAGCHRFSRSDKPKNRIKRIYHLCCLLHLITPHGIRFFSQIASVFFTSRNTLS